MSCSIRARLARAGVFGSIVLMLATSALAEPGAKGNPERGIDATAPAGGVAKASRQPVPGVRGVSIAEFRELLNSHRGHVVVLNLWASWCTPCLREIPELLKLAERYRKCGVRVFGLATDDPVELDGPVKAVHAKYFASFESYGRTEGEPDSYASVVDPAWNELMPTTYVIDASGKTVKRLQGGKSAEEFAKALEGVVACPQ